MWMQASCRSCDTLFYSDYSFFFWSCCFFVLFFGACFFFFILFFEGRLFCSCLDGRSLSIVMVSGHSLRQFRLLEIFFSHFNTKWDSLSLKIHNHNVLCYHSAYLEHHRNFALSSSNAAKFPNTSSVFKVSRSSWKTNRGLSSLVRSLASLQQAPLWKSRNLQVRWVVNLSNRGSQVAQFVSLFC